jgi:hypothetical protein
MVNKLDLQGDSNLRSLPIVVEDPPETGYLAGLPLILGVKQCRYFDHRSPDQEQKARLLSGCSQY